MRVTIKDVAAKAGVSTATVSLVLNDATGTRIPERTAVKVRAAAEALGYTSSALASGLRRQVSSIVGLISDEIATTPYAVRMVEAAGDVCRQTGNLLMLVNTGDDVEVERDAVRALRQHHVDRFVYACMHHKLVELPDGLATGTVILDGYEVSGTVPAVVPDEFQGAYDAVRELVDHGHTRIALLSDSDESAAEPLRRAAYLSALDDAGIELDPALVVRALALPGTAEAATYELWESAAPTAIFCYNDRMAVGVYRALRRLGLSIPDDVSVVGFDNMEIIAPELDPPLTSVQLPHYEMGLWALRRLLGLSAEDEGPWPYRMPCPLVRRQSVGPPRG